MSEPAKKNPQPETDLLEFLGGLDEIDDGDADFADFLANNDIERIAAPEKAARPRKEKPRE